MSSTDIVRRQPNVRHFTDPRDEEKGSASKFAREDEVAAVFILKPPGDGEVYGSVHNGATAQVSKTAKPVC